MRAFLGRLFLVITYYHLKYIMPLPSACRDSSENWAYSLMGVPLVYFLSFFPCCFNILCLSLIFVNFITMCLNVFFLRFILSGTLCFLDLIDCLLSRVTQFFHCNLLKYLSGLPLSSSRSPVIWMLVCCVLSRRSLRLSSFITSFFIGLISSYFHHSFNSLIHSSASVILLLFPSSVFYISVIVFISVCSLVLLLSCFSCVWLFETPWTVAHQAPLFMEFSRQEYWSGLPCPSPGDLPDPGIKRGLLHCRQILYWQL